MLPSASVGTPLHMAGRYRQERTAFSTLRSGDEPALSRIRGLCTLPSVPMMKLTLIVALKSGVSSKGFGVASGSGDDAASHRARVVARGMAAKRESRRADVHTWRSCAANEGCLSETLRGVTPEVAKQRTGDNVISSSGQSLRKRIVR